ncbi:MAG: alanine racemase, partial [Francisellaceae bacterium]
MLNHRAYAKIDLDALHHNLQFIKRLHPHKLIIAMLKADAYGHGAINIAKSLDGHCDYFGVASVEEGIELKTHGILQTKIMIFSGFFHTDQLPSLIKFDLIPIIHSRYQYELLEDYFSHKNSEIWLKINTGMNRLGMNEQDFNALYHELKAKYQQPIHVLTHLAESENADQTFTNRQLDCFYHLIKDKKLGHISAFNSAATLRHPFNNHGNTIRIGIALYGIKTMDDNASDRLNPVMEVCAHVIAIQHLKKGDSVGYNRLYIADEETKIAIICFGYGDGYPQFAPNGTPVMINNRLYPTAGKISMDLMAVDIGSDPIEIGAPVTLFGKTLPLSELAAKIGTSPYAMMTAINPRVKRC